MASLIQNIPMVFFLACGGTSMKGSASTGTSNVASLDFQSEATIPKENFPTYGAAENDSASSSLGWIAFGKELLPEGRPLLDWERQDADEFFWSQFA